MEAVERLKEAEKQIELAKQEILQEEAMREAKVDWYAEKSKRNIEIIKDEVRA